MQTSSPTVRTLRRRILALTISLVPSTMRGASVDTASGMSDVASEQRILLWAELRAEDREGTILAGGRVVREALAYRFRLTMTDAAGAAIAGRGEWEATVLVGGRSTNGALRPLIVLGSDASELTVPRPLGFRLDVGDSLLLIASMRESAEPVARRLVLVLDYESVAAGATRLAVAPLPATEGVVRRGATSAEWSWTPDSNGRILALAGLPLSDVRELSLVDLTTGERVWSATVRDMEGRAVFGKPGDVVRLGAAVVAGHTYRLRATLGRELEEGHTSAATLVAMILPSRPTGR